MLGFSAGVIMLANRAGDFMIVSCLRHVELCRYRGDIVGVLADFVLVHLLSKLYVADIVLPSHGYRYGIVVR